MVETLYIYMLAYIEIMSAYITLSSSSGRYFMLHACNVLRGRS